MVEPIDHQQMLDDLERAYALNPDNAGTQNALGYSLLEHSDDYQRAYELIESALSESPDDPAYLDSMGWALHKLERNSEALPYLERAFEQMPDPEVTSHLIIVLTQLGELERAQELLVEQEELHPGNEDLAEARRWLER
jgi:tetratricopeptide (TPR) repeat protein